MRTFLFLIALSVFCFEKTSAQCDVINDLDIINTADQFLLANMECTDNDGWTHYYNSTAGKILLSIKKNGQDIGSTGLGLVVQSGTLSSFGAGGFNLSNADYIANDVWVVSNRFWQVTGANDISSPVQVRFYFSDTDVSDIAESVDDFGFYVDEADDVLAYTLSSGNGISPYEENTQPTGAFLTIYDMVSGPAPDWMSGTLNGFHFAEFQVTTLDNAGSLGFLIFQVDPPVAVSGNIARPNGAGVAQATVEAASTSIAETGTDGSFICPTLITGGDYEIVPSKNLNPSEGVSVADLLRLSRHLLNLELLSTPFEFIASDVDDDSEVTFDDLNEIRNLVLGKSMSFLNSSWRFVREDYIFPNPTDPFSPPFPETIPLNNLPGALNNQDFIGVKIGDLVDDNIAPTPGLNTTFSLPSVNTCNPGDEIVFQMTVSDFQNIRGFQFTIEWDSEVMEYVDIENLQLPGFTQQSVGDIFVNDGELSFVWFNPADDGSTLNDGDVICDIRFLSTGEFDDSTPLFFSNSIAEAILIHQDLSQDNPSFNNGGMVIQNNSQLSAITDVIHAGCNGEPIGSIDLSVSGGTPPLSFNWNNGEITEDIANLPGGEYRVTVSDNSGNCPKVFFVDVAPTGPILIDAISTGMSCPSNVDGSIQLIIDGGPFTYNWSNGDDTAYIDGLYFGDYEVTVTDVAGCTATAIYEIDNLNQIQPNVSITNASNSTGQDGAVSINSIGGSSPPFSFQWSTGETSQSIENLNPGDYFVTITDGLDCQHVFGYLVSDLMTATSESVLLPSVNIFPNPVAEGHFFTLALQSKITAGFSVNIQSVNGKYISEYSSSLIAGDSSVELVAPDVPGLYFLQLKLDGQHAAWAKLVVR